MNAYRLTFTSIQGTVSSEESGAEEEETIGSDELPPKYDFLYPGHITTSTFQKSLLALGSGIASLLNPARDGIIIIIF